MTLLPLHVLGGAIGVLSGFVALYALKGGTLHRQSGTIFVYAMLALTLTGVVMAFGRPGKAINVPAGLVTAYLVITSLLTVRPPSARTRQLERGAMVGAFVVGGSTIAAAIVSGANGNNPVVYPLVMFAALALSAGAGDRRMLKDGGLEGRARIRRHLWRMCTALFIAAASFFLGPARRIPEPLRGPAMRLIPFVVLATMAYWLWRYRRSQSSRGVAGVRAPEAI